MFVVSCYVLSIVSVRERRRQRRVYISQARISILGLSICYIKHLVVVVVVDIDDDDDVVVVSRV